MPSNTCEEEKHVERVWQRVAAQSQGWRWRLFVQLQKRPAEICQGAEASRANTRDVKDQCRCRVNLPAKTPANGCSRPVQPNVPRGTTATRKYTKAVSAHKRKRDWREGQTRCSQASAGAGAKKVPEHTTANAMKRTKTQTHAQWD